MTARAAVGNGFSNRKITAGKDYRCTFPHSIRDAAKLYALTGTRDGSARDPVNGITVIYKIQ